MLNPHAVALPPSRSWGSYLPALVSLAAMVTILWRRFPSIYQDDAMWAEGGQLYFLEAHQGTLLDNVTALDFGYLPLWCRLWAFMVSRLGVPAAHTAHAYNLIALGVAALCCAAFALPHFRRLMASDICRVLVCLGLCCAPDYETKTFINASYYTAICCYLILSLAVQTRHFSLRSSLFGGIVLAISMLSKPHFMAFGPFLLAVWAAALLRRRTSLAILSGLPLIAIVLQFAVLYSHRAGVAPKALPLWTFVMVWGRWVVSALKFELFGQAIPLWKAPHLLGATAIVIFGGLNLLAQRRTLNKLLWPALLGTSLWLSGIALGILSFPDMYMSADVNYMKMLMQIRHFFVPLTGCYFTLALTMAHVVPRVAAPIFITVWLALAWPFGWVHAPQSPSWPTVGYSAWAALTHAMYDADDKAPARGCVPVNPYPWMLAKDCHMLEPIADVAELTHRPAVVLKDRYLAPAASKEWLVDTVGLRLMNIDTGTQEMVAYDATGTEQGRAKAIAAPGAVLTFFNFRPPLQAPAAVALIDTAMQPSGIVMDSAQTKPLWVWLGRQVPRGE